MQNELSEFKSSFLRVQTEEHKKRSFILHVSVRVTAELKARVQSVAGVDMLSSAIGSYTLRFRVGALFTPFDVLKVLQLKIQLYTEQHRLRNEMSTSKRVLLEQLDENLHTERVEDVIVWALAYYSGNISGTQGSAVAYNLVQTIKLAEAEEREERAKQQDKKEEEVKPVVAKNVYFKIHPEACDNISTLSLGSTIEMLKEMKDNAEEYGTTESFVLETVLLT